MPGQCPSVSQVAASWRWGSLTQAPAASLPASEPGVGSAGRVAFGERFNLGVSDFLSGRRDDRVLHRLLRGGAALMFVKPLAQSWAASAMRLEGESSDEAGGAMQRWRDGDRQTETDGRTAREGGGSRPGGGRGAARAPQLGLGRPRRWR